MNRIKALFFKENKKEKIQDDKIPLTRLYSLLKNSPNLKYKIFNTKIHEEETTYSIKDIVKALDIFYFSVFYKKTGDSKNKFDIITVSVYQFDLEVETLEEAEEIIINKIKDALEIELEKKKRMKAFKEVFDSVDLESKIDARTF